MSQTTDTQFLPRTKRTARVNRLASSSTLCLQITAAALTVTETAVHTRRTGIETTRPQKERQSLVPTL